ncbi:VOC family protein [Alphaproteobacteria bacterium KMM 3653]|uniref:VOC family protein n=1 Tax=Harenicola maris TaxID=2841044 RepID=A0AAP2G3G8_9RHOB|nr:VOC family protein [Harenicola maris]
MNAAFGLDHPLLATYNIEGLRKRLIALGFNMTPIGKHPWGTSTSLAMFNGCLLEIMGIYDDSLIDALPAGDFRFGRHIHTHLQQREGVALTALHSTGSQRDAERAAACGFDIAGHLEFGRDVTLPDGRQGRTKTTLALMPDREFPRLSLFLCQQHRPDLIYVPEWLRHPNGVTGICGVNVIADTGSQPKLNARFSGLYGPAAQIPGGMAFATANGTLRIMTPQAFTDHIGPVAEPLRQEQTPCIAGMDFTLPDPAALRPFLQASKTAFTETETTVCLTQPEETANTLLRFCRP